MLVIIPARAGSKGVFKKNIKELNGKPLIQYTIDAARKVFKDSDIVVSTDSPEIKKIASKKLPVDSIVIRPSALATDTTSMNDVLLNVIETMEKRGKIFKTVILLQPTSPFRKPIHIKEALKLYNSEFEMLVSVKETKANPYYTLQEENSDGYLERSKDGNFIRRQDCPKVWELNGAIYIINVDALKAKPIYEFKKVKKYVMDEISSIDIDSSFDWSLAETIIEKSHLLNLKNQLAEIN
ncbi:MAG TPA: acylneuraminate cytidylyltransferase family protein [Salinimicrobium sp.]|nr:acylneuraminate cytidylyltransferase family protein [Salinimicrobium sp.]